MQSKFDNTDNAHLSGEGDQEMTMEENGHIHTSLTPTISEMQINTETAAGGLTNLAPNLDLLSSVRDVAKQIQEQIAQRPAEKLKELNMILEAHCDQIWAFLHAGPDPKASKAQFYQHVFKATAERLLKWDKVIDNPAYLAQIMRFFRNILVNFYPKDLRDDLGGIGDLSEVVHMLFNLDAHLYTVALQSELAKRELTSGGHHILREILDAHYRAANEAINQGREPEPVSLNREQEGMLSLDQKRLVREVPWRLSLKKGDRIDAVFGVAATNVTRVQHWMPATITCIIEDQQDLYSNQQDSPVPAPSMAVQPLSEQKFFVRFDGVPGEGGDQHFFRDSLDIAPLNTFTSDFQWRWDLQAGELIDCIDSEGNWYRSTVLDTRERIEEEVMGPRRIKEAYIGYRYYEEEGHKIDEETKEKYTGWSSKYDIWLPVSNPQVQRLKSVSRFYRVAGRNQMNYDDYNLNDGADVFFNTRETKVWVMSRINHFQNLKCITDFLNEFAAEGGYERILELLDSVHPSLTMKTIFHYIEFLSKTMPLWHHQFACSYIPKLNIAFEKVMSSQAITRKFHRDSFSGALKAFNNVLRRYYPMSASSVQPKQIEDNFPLITSNVTFISSIALIKSDKLELRVAGLNQINDQLKNTRYMQVSRKGLSDKDILHKLNEMQVLESIFGGAESHVQLVQRGEEVLRFLIDQKAFGEQEIRTVWDAIIKKGDQATKLEFYKILEGLQIKLRNDDVALIIELFGQIEPQSFMRQEIECVAKLIQFCQRQIPAIIKAATLFFDIACQVRPYPKEIIESALDKLIGLLMSQDRALKLEYINMCYERLEKELSPLQSIKIMQKILDQIPKDKMGSLISGQEIAQDLIEKYNLINMIIFDLSRYTEVANAEWAKGVINTDNVERVEMFDTPFSHRINIAARLAFIKQLLTFSGTQIQQDQLDSIWDILMTRSKITIDQHLFFDWFKLMLQEHNRISMELIQSFFETRVCAQTQPGSFKDIKKAGFDCIQQMFLLINEQDDKIHIITLPSPPINGVATKLDFSVLAIPSQLRGIEVVWRILQDCDKKNADLTAIVIDLITKLYHNVTDQITPEEVAQFQSEFCSKWLEQLKLCAENASQSDEDKKAFVKSSAAMLKSFLQDSERNGSATLRCHAALERGTFIEKIVLQNQISNLKNLARVIEVNTYSNMTLWELKRLAAQKFKISPKRIELKRADNNKPALNDLQHSRMLRELKVESFEIIQVQKKPMVFQARKPLLTKKKELAPEARAVFTSWFNMFSEDGFMLPQHCVEFIKFTTGSANMKIEMNDERVALFYQSYDPDADGKITLEDFLKFYKDKSIARAEVVWNNLTNAKYGNDFKPLSDQNCPDDPNEQKSFALLPRCKLTKDQGFYREFVSVLKTLPLAVSDELWPLLAALRTNPESYSQLLAKNSSHYLSSKTDNFIELLYSLQIVESFINDFQCKSQPTTVQYFSEAPLGQDQEQFPSVGEAYNASSENMRDENLAQASKSGAIPLPPAQLNLPEPPKVPFVGPLPPPSGTSSGGAGPDSAATSAEQQKRVNTLLEQYKNNILSEPGNDTVLEDSEICEYLALQDGCEVTLEDVARLRGNWISNFVKNRGVQLLMSILKDLNKVMELHKKGEILKSKIEKDCWNQVLKILKVLLMSTFVGKLPSAELSQALERKMSQHQEAQPQTSIDSNNTTDSPQKPSEVKKSNIQVDQEKTTKQFGPLIETLSGESGDELLRQLDLVNFQQQILQIVKQVLTKKDQISYEEKQIIDLAMSTWISCIVYNPTLLQGLYQEKAAQSSIDTSSFTKILIEDGLLCTNIAVRIIFRDGIKFICESVQTKGLSEKPYAYFLSVMLHEASITQNKPKESKQFYQLLSQLLHMYLDAKKVGLHEGPEIFNHQALLEDYIQRLVSYNSSEKKGTSYNEDNNLIGYLQLIQELIKSDPSAISEDSSNALIFEIMTRLLFTMEIKAFDRDISSDTDLIEYEKPFINKCSSLGSRKAAFSLLNTLCQINPRLAYDMIVTYLQPILMKVKKPKKSGYAPRTDQRTNGFCGLKNLGSICYMNSMMQQFFNTPTFRYSILSVQDGVQENLVSFENELTDDNLLHQLIKMTGFLELSERQEYNPREFCFSFKDYSGQPTNVRIQQDSQEFLGVAFSRIESMLAKTSMKYLLQNIFGGQQCAIRICKACGDIEKTYDQFYNLTLQVKDQRSIYDGLKRLTTGELIEGFKCSACQQTVNIERKTVLYQLPNMLIIHLQRIVFDMDTFVNKKLNQRIEFPNVLNVQPFMLSEAFSKSQSQDARNQQPVDSLPNPDTLQRGPQHENSKEDDEEMAANSVMSPSNQEQMQQVSNQDDTMREENAAVAVESAEPKENFEYKLVGVVVHMGTADAGHYLSYININRGEKSEESPEWLQTDKDKWLEFNDSAVRSYSFQNLEGDCFGGEGGANNSFGVQTSSDVIGGNGDYTKNAYMLVYEKRRKEPMKIVVPETFAKQSLSQTADGTSVTRVEEFSKLCPMVDPTKLPQDGVPVTFDQSLNEHYALIDFNAVRKYVPNSVYQMVHNDNHAYLFERQIFTLGFFEAAKEMYETLLKQSPEVFQAQISSDLESGENPLFSFMERLVFDIIPMSSDNKCLIDFVKVYIQILQRNFQETVKLIKKRILVEAGAGQSKREFFETLIQSMDASVRELNAHFLLHSVNACFANMNQDPEAKELLDKMMEQVFACLPEDLCKNWLKIHQYLWFLNCLAQSGTQQLLYLMEKNIITKLADFFMENESPAVTIGKGKRRQLMGSNYANPPFEQLLFCISYITRMQTHVDLQGSQPEEPLYYPKHSIFTLNQNSQQIQLPPLSKDDRYMLSQKAFIDKCLKCNQSVVEVAKLLCHLACFNKDFSRRLAKRSLIGVNKASGDEIFPYISVLIQQLSIFDTMRFQRFEWILGVPAPAFEKPSIYNQNQNPLPKMGVATAKFISSEIYEYRSTLFKTTSQIKESYLQLLFSQRNKWPKYALDSLIALLQACVYDLNFGGMLFHYLFTLEPPTYQFARYIDWIRPWLAEHIDFCMRNSNIQANQLELNLAIQASQLLEQIITARPYSGEMKLQAQPQVQDNFTDTKMIDTTKKVVKQRRPFQYQPDDHGAQACIIWEVVEERIVEHTELSEHNIEVYVTELKCRLSNSLADGFWNQVFSKNFFQPHGSQGQRQVTFNSFGSVDTSQWGKTRGAYGRGNSNYNTMTNLSGITVMTNTQGRGGARSGGGAAGHHVAAIRKRKSGHSNLQGRKRRNKDGTSQFKESNVEQVQGALDLAGLKNFESGSEDEYFEEEEETRVQASQGANSNLAEVPENSMECYEEHEGTQGANQIKMEGCQGDQEDTFNFVDQPASNNQDAQDGPIHTQQHHHSDTTMKIHHQEPETDQPIAEPQDVRQFSSAPQEHTPFQATSGSVPQPSSQSQDAQPVDQASQEEGKVQNGNEDQRDDVWQAELWSVLVYTVFNNDKTKAQKVTMKFDHTYENILSQDPLAAPVQQVIPNVRLPNSEVPFQIFSGCQRDCVVLTKLRPFEDWSKFKWQVYVPGDKKEAGLNPILGEQSQVPGAQQAAEMIPELIRAGGADGIEDQHMIEQDFNYIGCPVCTFHNSLEASSCEMCGGKLQ